MNVLLIGSGGREHALAWAIAASPLLTQLFIAPGNPGTAECGENIVLDVRDHGAVISFCRLMAIGLIVIGPEAPLVAGLADDLRAAGLKVFGHGREAARLEGSKAFTKEICDAASVPTAAYGRFRDASAAKTHVVRHGAPIVVKYDGLAAGKGVVVAMTVAEANAAVDMMFAGQFGDAEIVIEEFMEGEEVSFFALVHGEQTLALAAAQDHKRVGDGDTGPNTGGMGAYSPAPAFTSALEAEVMERIIRPTAREMVRRGAPCSGVLFAGLMLTAEGPKLIEYNVRFGDPECQVLMLRLRDDILTLLLATAEGQLDKVSARWKPEPALTVVMAAKGYPDTPLKGTVISGLDRAAALEGATIFHAGTRRNAAGHLLADGGRVLNISAVGSSVAEARVRAYAAVDALEWPEGFCRRDIAWRALKG